VLQQLHYADEVRAPDEIPLDDAELKEPEVQLALKLIEQTSSEGFHPERYEDSVKKRVLEAIERKVQGEQIRAAEPAAPQGQVIDLMEALKASLAASEAGAARSESGSKEAPRREAAREVGEPAPERKGPRAVRPAREKEKEKATGRK
jgi:DNA end-binding protein Ku